MRATAFTRARWAIGIAFSLAIGSMLRYPGGTFLDRSTTRYALDENFLSDLGMTVAHGGGRNTLGAALFVASLVLLVAALGGCLVGLVRLYAASARARPWALAAGGVGLVACLAFLGVALTPENRALALHIGLTKFAWRVMPGVSLLLGVASVTSEVFPWRVAVAWGALTAALVAYVAVLGWGPSLSTVEGLRVHVVAQKLIAVTVIAAVAYLSVEADRVVHARGAAGRHR